MKRVKVFKINTLKPRSKAPRRKRGELIRCFRCPPEHPGWKRSELRNRRKLPHCLAHRKSHDEIHQPWPICPKCGEDEFGTMEWGGDVLSTIALCTLCDFRDKASKYFSILTINTIAKPIESERS